MPLKPVLVPSHNCHILVDHSQQLAKRAQDPRPDREEEAVNGTRFNTQTAQPELPQLLQIFVLPTHHRTTLAWYQAGACARQQCQLAAAEHTAGPNMYPKLQVSAASAQLLSRAPKYMAGMRTSLKTNNSTVNKILRVQLTAAEPPHSHDILNIKTVLLIVKCNLYTTTPAHHHVFLPAIHQWRMLLAQLAAARHAGWAAILACQG